MRGVVRLLLVSLLGLAGVLGISGRADAAGDFFACVDAGNVWVVVEYAGSSTSQGCAVAPATGLAALRQVTSVRMSSSGMVAQIGGNPAALDPDPNVYWNYFHKDKAGSGWGTWVYSSLGAGAYQPKPGSVEGWTYGRTGTSMKWSPPPRPAATTAAPATTKAPAPVTTGPVPAPATTARAQTSATSGPTPAPTMQAGSIGPAPADLSAEPSISPGSVDTLAATPAPESTAVTSAPESAVPNVVSAGPDAMRPVDRGTPAATVATLAVVAAAGAAGGGWWLLRRRRTTP